jgi:hypothetical protein
MIPEARLAHASAGRMRLRFPSLRANPAALAAIAKRLEGCPGVRTTESNPVTGAVLVLHDSDTKAIAEFAQQNSLFAIRREVNPPQGRVRKNITDTVSAADRTVQNASGGNVDLGLASAAALTGAGLLQLLRGGAGPLPWHSAFWYAYNVFRHSKRNTPQSGE